MNPNIKLINAYFIQELSEEEVKKYNNLISADSDKILIVCKSTLRRTFEEINVVKDVSQNIKETLKFNKIFYLENKKDNSRDLIIYRFLGTTKINIVDCDYLTEYLNSKYKKIVLVGYYNSFEINWEEILDIDESQRFLQ